MIFPESVECLAIGRGALGFAPVAYPALQSGLGRLVAFALARSTGFAIRPPQRQAGPDVRAPVGLAAAIATHPHSGHGPRLALGWLVDAVGFFAKQLVRQQTPPWRVASGLLPPSTSGHAFVCPDCQSLALWPRGPPVRSLGHKNVRCANPRHGLEG